MTSALILLAAASIAVVAIVGTIRAVARDGLRRIPARRRPSSGTVGSWLGS